MSDVVKLYDPSQVVESAIDSWQRLITLGKALISTDRKSEDDGWRDFDGKGSRKTRTYMGEKDFLSLTGLIKSHWYHNVSLVS